MATNSSPTWNTDPKKKDRYVIRFPPEPGVHAGAVAYVSLLNDTHVDFYFWSASVSIDSHYAYTESGDASTIDQAFADADNALHKLAQKTAKHYQG